MKRIRVLLPTLILALTGCQSTQTIWPTANTIMVIDDTLVFDGMITGDSVLEAVRAVRESGAKITKLRITSQGGDMGVGIEFGYFVKENDLDVEISELCFSSCANYIIPAAKSVVVNANSMIGWHGGAKQADKLWELSVPEKDRPAFMAYLNRLRVKETAFFGVVGVDQQITTYGQTIASSCQAAQMTDGWYYSLEDLNKMGIKDITVKGGGLLSEMKYKDDSGRMDTTHYTGEKITSCLLSNVFDS